MVAARTIWTLGTIAACCLLSTPLASSARTRVVEKPLVDDPTLLPAAAAPRGLSAPVLSSLNYSSAAPPDIRLRVVEDEPYAYLTGLHCDRRLEAEAGFSAITLSSLRPDGGSYRARISLEWEPKRSEGLQVLRRFDLAAHNAHLTSAVQAEPRGKDVYAVHELRSPLGISQDAKGRPTAREFLAYTAAISNPLSLTFAQPTPYDFDSGDLLAVIETKDADWLVVVEFEARRFPNSIRLTENLARLVACQLLSMHGRPSLELLDYPPEYELPQGDLTEYPVDPATADLAEQPADECGAPALPAGGYQPACDIDSPAPARPYEGRFSPCLSTAQESCNSACADACIEAGTWQPMLTGPQDQSARPPASGWQSPSTQVPEPRGSGPSILAQKLRAHLKPEDTQGPPADPQDWADPAG